MSRIIMHIDMDCFFAAVETAKNPKLKGKPVVIGADPKGGRGRGVASTASMEARKYGIKSATPISKAYELCPEAMFIRPDFKLYCRISKEIMKILKKHAERFQKVSIDEAYLDVTGKAPDWADAKILAYKIKNEIYEKHKLTCSIGIANNKLVAKIASEHDKPDGITVVKNNKEFLEPLPVRKLYGVGPKTEKKLKKLGIKTIGDLASYNKEALMKKFGIYGLYLSLSANGDGSDFVSQQYGRKSIGHETTFYEDIENFEEILGRIELLAKDAHERLVEDKYVCKTISIKVRLHNFDTFTRALTLNCFCSSKKIIINTAKLLFKEFFGKRIRLVGIRLSNLEEFKHQKTLINYCP